MIGAATAAGGLSDSVRVIGTNTAAGGLPDSVRMIGAGTAAGGVSDFVHTTGAGTAAGCVGVFVGFVNLVDGSARGSDSSLVTVRCHLLGVVGTVRAGEEADAESLPDETG